MATKRWLGMEKRSAMDLLKSILTRIQEDNCTAYAATVAYWFFYALFPFLIFLTALLPYLPLPNLLELLMQGIRNLFPEEALGLIREHLRNLVSQHKGGLLSFGIILALWTSSSAVVSLSDALNRVYRVRESRSFLKLRLTALLLVIGLSLFLSVSAVLVVSGPKIGAAIAAKAGLGGLFTALWNILRWPFIVILVAVAASIVYYFAPNVRQDWKWITPGSLLVVLLWIALSVAFAYYVNNFGSYDKTYGSLGAVIVMLTWLYLSSFILLLGGEVNAEIENSLHQPPGRR
jgi:membrane protein